VSDLRISKTALLYLKRCDKAFYFYTKFPWLKSKPDAFRQYLFDKGNELGMLARKLFPDGKDASESGKAGAETALHNTRKWIEEGAEVIYEATFEKKHALVMVDILVKNGDSWNIYEVKSSRRLSEHHIIDAGFQYYVVSDSLPVQDVFLVYPDSNYQLVPPLDVKKFFIRKSVLKLVKERKNYFEKMHRYALKVLLTTVTPEIKTGLHCLQPGLCDFASQCFPQNILNHPDSVLLTKEIPPEKRIEYFQNNIFFIQQIPEQEIPSFSQKNFSISDFNKDTLSEKLRCGSWICFDMEFYTGPVPFLLHHHPFEPVCVAADIFLPEDSSHETFFLDDTNLDAWKSMMRKILDRLQQYNTILLFDKQQEKEYASVIQRHDPENAPAWKELMEKALDIKLLFRHHPLSHEPQMKGMYSLKNITEKLGFSRPNTDMKEGYEVLMQYENYLREKEEIKKMFIKECITEYVRSDTERIAFLIGKMIDLS
jgi:hypothetical protein